MDIERIDDPDLIDRLGQSTAPRSEGLHLSQIYGSLMSQLQPKRFDKSKALDKRRLEMGLIFENSIEPALASKFATVRPGEIISPEGVAMTPDGVNPTEGAGEEYKFTTMSSAIKDGATPYTDEYGLPNDKFLHWFIQMKGYAKWLETDTFLLRVLHVNGRYEKYKFGEPEFLTHRIRFTPAEIDENWQMLMTHARQQGMLR